MKKFNLYIHIPFCQRICIYCDFYVTTARKLQGEFTEALLEEIGLVAERFPEASPETIYFGGGTPSILSEDSLKKINDRIRSSLDVSPSAEVTIECNPNNLTLEKLKTFQKMGIKRLSVGVQSFLDNELRFLTRNHTALQAREGLQNARDAGFTNVSLDLIFGLPGQSPDQWEQNIAAAIEFEPEHISIYNLTVEERTHLFKLVSQKKIQMPDENVELNMFHTTIEILTKAGYEHYEISNYAKPGYRSKHNSSYWTGNHYLGLGPSAHSFDGSHRWWNVKDINKYRQCLLEDRKLPIDDQEELTGQQKIMEAVFLGLRRYEGIEIKKFEKLYGIGFLSLFKKPLQELSSFIVNDGQTVRLSDQGLFLYNKICEEFVSVL